MILEMSRVLCVAIMMIIVVNGENPWRKREEIAVRKEVLIEKDLTGVEEEEGEEEEEDLPMLSISPRELKIEVGKTTTLEISLSQQPQECIEVNLTQSSLVGEITPQKVILCDANSSTLTFHASTRGVSIITASPFPPDCCGQPSPGGTFSVVNVRQSKTIDVVADVIGWLYTIAWDVSFLPQILKNWRRKSVIGLSFDFLAFNFLGFFSYFIFNMGLYWLHDIQEQYGLRHPQSILHVRLNDVIFPLYALACTCLQIVQCLVYTRAEGQRVSVVCRVVVVLLVGAAVIGSVIVPFQEDWWWLDVLYLLSYVKLIITCIKYLPQLWVNYKGRSTEGWSIYQVILDFTGGTLSLVQMFLLSANYDDWNSILTDPTKLGLGLLSILFNIVFFVQHYCLYRKPPSATKEMKGVDNPLEVQDDSPVTSRM